MAEEIFGRERERKHVLQLHLVRSVPTFLPHKPLSSLTHSLTHSLTPTAPLKQRLLQRWREREISQTRTIARAPVIQSPEPADPDVLPAPSAGVERGSPLFEEFSDDEFDAVRVERGREVEMDEGKGGEKVERESDRAPVEAEENDDSLSERFGDSTTTVSQTERGVVNDIIPDSGAGLKAGERGGDSEELGTRSEVVGVGGEKTEVVRKIRSLEELMSEDVASGGRTLEELMVMDMAESEGAMRREGEGGAMFASGDPREPAGQLFQTKTPVKRKVSHMM